MNPTEALQLVMLVPDKPKKITIIRVGLLDELR